MAKIKSQLEAGKNVVITSGLVQELQDKGLSDIVDVRYTSRKAMVNQYAGGFGGPYDTGQNNRDVLIPIIEYVTNDAVPMVRAIANGNGFPILLSDHYSKGTIFILTVPDNFSDLLLIPTDGGVQHQEFFTWRLPCSPGWPQPGQPLRL